MSEEKEKNKEQSKVLTDKTKSETINATQSVCHSCNNENDSSALFCGECGARLKQPAHCPKCNATTRPNADICEVCGTWLLKGQCMFCYAPVDEDQAYCGECGNPPTGIPCPQCGVVSIFDFCKSCGIPLSTQAKEMIVETARNPLYQEMASLLNQLDSLPIGELDIDQSMIDPVSHKESCDDQVLRLRKYRESLSKPTLQHKNKTAPRALFSNEQKERISRLNDDVVQEVERKRLEEIRRLREEEERRRDEEERQRMLLENLNREMSKFSVMTFSSNQEARRFFMSIIAELPEEVARKIIDGRMKWRCNAYGVVHDSPTNCGGPSGGGVWLIF